LLAERGCETVRWTIIPDDPNLLRDAVTQAARECDAVALIAGASVGERDHTAAVLAQLGEVIVHGVAMRPGKPVILGIIGKVPFIGVPGYPVSAVICFEQFVEPLIARWLGVAQPPERMCTAIMSRDIPSQAGSEEFVRVRLGEVNGRLIAVPLARGAGLITSLVRADGVLRIPALSEGLLEGEPADCALRVPEGTLSSTLLITGSHDLSLDLLDSMLRQSHEGRAVPQTARHILAPSTRRRAQMRVASIHVGSQAGLSALRGGYCHAAGTHLLDPDTGEYNVAYVRRLFAPGEVSLITVALRQQGLIVAPGNPLGLQTWADLARPGLRFINRQRGAGTRVLLDYELRRAGVDGSTIEGYPRTVYTHLAVAAAVQSGAADVGVGIAAAARALDLGFVPLASERYELAVPRRSLDAQPVAALIEVLSTADFKDALHSLGGYDVGETGAVRAA
jgi:putative molybdopterin biosynthesis protein